MPTRRAGYAVLIWFVPLHRGGVDDYQIAAAYRLIEIKRHLIVFVMARGPKSALRVKRRAVDALREQGLVARYRMLVKPSANALASVIGREGCGTLVLPAKCALLDRDAVVALLDTLDLPALLIR